MHQLHYISIITILITMRSFVFFSPWKEITLMCSVYGKGIRVLTEDAVGCHDIHKAVEAIWTRIWDWIQGEWRVVAWRSCPVPGMLSLLRRQCSHAANLEWIDCGISSRHTQVLPCHGTRFDPHYATHLQFPVIHQEAFIRIMIHTLRQAINLQCFPTHSWVLLLYFILIEPWKKEGVRIWV